MRRTSAVGPATGAPALLRAFGQERLALWLRDLAASDRIGQGLLLEGPPGTGKGELALATTQALLCSAASPDDRPCGSCRTCRLVAHRTCPDVHWVEPPLRIEGSRELQHLLSLAPSECRRRVAILPEIDLATTGAANSLLKTIEEPPPHAVLLLTAGDAEAVLPTIRSRCRVMSVRPAPSGAVADALVAERSMAPEQAALVARVAGGRAAWAVRLCDEPAILERRAAALDGLESILSSDAPTRLSLAGQMARREDDLTETLSAWSSWWRDVMLLHLGIDEQVANRDRFAPIGAAARRFGLGQIIRALHSLDDGLARLAANVQPQLDLEVLVLELPS